MNAATDSEIALKGLRVLVVEDSFLIAWSLRRMLTELGCVVLGPVSSVSEAMETLKNSACDGGILDINLGSETSIPIAQALVDQGRPFMFVTGYSSPALTNMQFDSYRRLRKPLTEGALRSAMLEDFVKH